MVLSKNTCIFAIQNSTGLSLLKIISELQSSQIRDSRLPPLCTWDLRCSGVLCSVNRLLVTDVSGQPLGPIFKHNLENETDNLPETSVTEYQSTLRNIPEERKSLRYFFCQSILWLDRWYFSFLLTKTIRSLTPVASESSGMLWDSLDLLFNV
jgi:hypothetical protein